MATDCSVCVYCKDKRKFGGPGRKKKGCIQRKCVFLSSGEASTVSLGNIKIAKNTNYYYMPFAECSGNTNYHT